MRKNVSPTHNEYFYDDGLSTGCAAKETRGLIATSVERVGAGAQLAQGSGTAMQAIVTRAHDAADQVTQQNAALVEQTTAASERLKAQAHRLNEAVNVYK